MTQSSLSRIEDQSDSIAGGDGGETGNVPGHVPNFDQGTFFDLFIIIDVQTFSCVIVKWVEELHSQDKFVSFDSDMIN